MDIQPFVEKQANAFIVIEIYFVCWGKCVVRKYLSSNIILYTVVTICTFLLLFNIYSIYEYILLCIYVNVIYIFQRHGKYVKAALC